MESKQGTGYRIQMLRGTQLTYLMNEIEQIWFPRPAELLICWVTLEAFQDFSVPHFPRVENGHDGKAYLVELFWGPNEVVQEKVNRELSKG